MRRRIINAKSLIIFLMTGVLVMGCVNGSGVNAAVSTNYQVVSSRNPGTTYTQRAFIESPHSVSGNGRYVVFSSEGTDFAINDTNGVKDVFVRDTNNGVTSLVSVSTGGVQANSYSEHASISYDGRYIVFESTADNLAPGITGTSISHVYIRDLVAGTTVLVDSSSSGSGNGYASSPKVSADGRFVVFTSAATNLISGINTLGKSQIYIKDMHTNATKLLSVTSTGVVGNQDSFMPDISCDGNVVVFASKATSLGVPSGQPGRLDLIVTHLGWSGDELKDVTSYLNYGIIARYEGAPQISCDGNIALYVSTSTNAVSPSTPSGYVNAYEYNRLNEDTLQASLGNGNVQADIQQQGQYLNASMSNDGSYVVFTNYANNMDTTYPTGYDTGSTGSVYVRDMRHSTTETVTIHPSGNRSAWTGGVAGVSMSGNGSHVVFTHVTPGISTPERALISGFTTGFTAGSQDVYRTETGH